MSTQPPKGNSTSKRKRGFPRTDAGNAEFFADQYKNKLRYDFGRSRWLSWSTHWWVEDRCQVVMQMAKAAARSRYLLRGAASNDDKEDKKEADWATTSESRERLKAVLDLSKTEPALATTGLDWDADLWLLGVRNGILNLRTGKLRDGQRSDLITMHTDIVFDARATCPEWLKFLDEVFDGDTEVIEYVQRAAGYCLTGDTTEQVIFLCHGAGANGKSTFLDVLRYVLGDYAYSLPFATFELKSRSAIPNDVAALPGRRFVTALETNESAALNEARIKLLTGCDPVSARSLYREFFTFTPAAKFWLAMNHRPLVTDDSSGFWRRIRLIPFLQQFEGLRADKGLAAKLKSEAPGILRWILEGCLLWQRQGLGLPAIVETASQAYREENDQVGEFIGDCCLVVPDVSVGAGNLWYSYLSWSEGNHERPLDRKVFSARLEAKGFRKGRVGHERTWTWFGLCLNSEEGSQPQSDVGAGADGCGRENSIAATEEKNICYQTIETPRPHASSWSTLTTEKR